MHLGAHQTVMEREPGARGRQRMTVELRDCLESYRMSLQMSEPSGTLGICTLQLVDDNHRRRQLPYSRHLSERIH